MRFRAAYTLVAALVVVVAVSAAAAGAQTQPREMDELWEQYPLEAPPDGQRRVGDREESGSTAGPPPRPTKPGGPFPLALLLLALALAGVVLAIGALRAGAALRGRRRRERSRLLGARAGHLDSGRFP